MTLLPDTLAGRGHEDMSAVVPCECGDCPDGPVGLFSVRLVVEQPQEMQQMSMNEYRHPSLKLLVVGNSRQDVRDVKARLSINFLGEPQPLVTPERPALEQLLATPGATKLRVRPSRPSHGCTPRRARSLAANESAHARAFSSCSSGATRRLPLRMISIWCLSAEASSSIRSISASARARIASASTGDRPGVGAHASTTGLVGSDDSASSMAQTVVILGRYSTVTSDVLPPANVLVDVAISLA